MSSDGNNDFAHEYPAGAIADSPIPFSSEVAINAPVSVPIPVVDFTTLQHLNPIAPVFSPQPVTASSSVLRSVGRSVRLGRWGVCPECRQGVERICRAITKQVQRSNARIEVDVMHTWNECTE
jgi:hypothetical protein